MTALELPVLVPLGAVLLPAVLLPVELTKEQMLLLLLTNNKQNWALRAYDGLLQISYVLCCKCKANRSL